MGRLPGARPLFFFFFPLAGAAALLLGSGAAHAQVNGDVGLSAGAMKRFTTGADPGVSDPGFGPVFQLQGHLALFPMLRVGLYVSQDVSPMPSYGGRQFYEGGLHLKLTPPILPTPWKGYAFAGFGGGYAHQDSYAAPGAPPGGSATRPTVSFSSIDGALFEIPVGIGVAYRLRAPFEVFVELAGRFGVGFVGRMYDPNNTATGNEPQVSPAPSGPYTGQDSFALTLSAGVSLSD